MAQERLRISEKPHRQDQVEKETQVNLVHFRSFVLIIPATLALAACQRGKDAQTEPAIAAGPDIAVTDGMLTLPVIKGNPGAAYFTVTNRGKATATIAAIDVDGASKVEMHDSKDGVMSAIAQVPVQPGHSVRFSPGAKHAMVFDIDGKLAAGGKTRITLIFDDGAKVSAPLEITATGAGTMSDMGGMAGMGSKGHS